MYTTPCNPFAPCHGAETRVVQLHIENEIVVIQSGWNSHSRGCGHPEWLDFPQQGARRQMKLTNHPLLHYQYLLKFDKAMQKLDDAHSFMKLHLCQSQAQCNVNHRVGVQRPVAWEVWTPRSTSVLDMVSLAHCFRDNSNCLVFPVSCVIISPCVW